MLKLATKFAPEPAAFEMAHAAGFRYAEIWLDARLLTGWPTIAALARQYPLEYVLHFPNRTDLTYETQEHVAQLYHELGCRCLVIHQPQSDRFQAALLSLEPGMQLAVENHHLDPQSLEGWAAANCGLALDVEHFWMLTLRNVPLAELLTALRAFLTRWHQKLRHVHLPGYVPGFDEHRPMYCSREMVFAVLSLLEEFRFEGLIVSEVEPEFQTLNDLRMDVLLFETWQETCARLAEAP